MLKLSEDFKNIIKYKSTPKDCDNVILGIKIEIKQAMGELDPVRVKNLKKELKNVKVAKETVQKLLN